MGLEHVVVGHLWTYLSRRSSRVGAPLGGGAAEPDGRRDPETPDDTGHTAQETGELYLDAVVRKRLAGNRALRALIAQAGAGREAPAGRDARDVTLALRRAIERDQGLARHLEMAVALIQAGDVVDQPSAAGSANVGRTMGQQSDMSVPAPPGNDPALGTPPRRSPRRLLPGDGRVPVPPRVYRDLRARELRIAEVEDLIDSGDRLSATAAFADMLDEWNRHARMPPADELALYRRLVRVGKLLMERRGLSWSPSILLSRDGAREPVPVPFRSAPPVDADFAEPEMRAAVGVVHASLTRLFEDLGPPPASATDGSQVEQSPGGEERR